MQKSTHQAHCQVCGRIQAVMLPSGLLAKHGYTVTFGFFQGTCAGSDHLPLEQERVLCLDTCISLMEYARLHREQVKALQAGTAHPSTAKTGRSVKGPKGWADEVVAFELAPADMQKRAVDAAIWNTELQATQAEAHRMMLTTLAARVHGQPLTPIVKAAKVAVVAPTVDVAAGKVTGQYATKAARKADLDRLSREYEKAHHDLQKMYLAMSNAERTEERTELYYGPNQLNNWRPRHSEAARRYFPGSDAIVARIEALVQAREAVKNA